MSMIRTGSNPDMWLKVTCLGLKNRKNRKDEKKATATYECVQNYDYDYVEVGLLAVCQLAVVRVV